MTSESGSWSWSSRQVPGPLAELRRLFVAALQQDAAFDPTLEEVVALDGESARAGHVVERAGRDRRLGRAVTARWLEAGAPVDEERTFLREVAVLARLDHRGVPPPFAAGRTAAGQPFLVTRLLPRASLRDGLPPEQALRAIVAVAETVAFAHRRGVVHGALALEHVRVGPHGDVLVLGWGHAHVADGEPPVPPQASPHHAPELAHGPASPRADVFSLGRLLGEALGPDAPRELRAIVTRATARAPERRYPHATAFLDDVRAFLDGERVSAHAYGTWERLARHVRRRPAAWAASMLGATLMAIAALVAAGVGAAAERTTQAAARDAARRTWVERRAVDDGFVPALRALSAAQRWRTLAPDDADAARAHAEALCAAVVRAGEAGQWELGADLVGRARELGLEPAAVAVATRAFEAARAREAGRRATEMLALLDRCEQDVRPSFGAHDDQVLRAVLLADTPGVALAADRLDAVSAALEEVARESWREAAEPTAEEHMVGERPVVGLAGLSCPEATDEGRHLLRLAAERLWRRAGAPRGQDPMRMAYSMLAARQESAVGRGRLAAAQVCCGVLGFAGDAAPERAVAALVRYLWAEHDDARAARAAAALWRLTRLEGTAALERVAARFPADGRFVRATSTREASGTVGPERHLAAAEADLAAGRLDAARRGFSRALALRTDLAPAWSGRGRTRRDLGDVVGALEDLERAVVLSPRDAAAWTALSETHRRRGDLASARRCADRAVDSAPDDAAPRLQRSVVAAEQQDLDQALQDGAAAARLAPGSGPAWRNLGALQLGRGDVEAATAALTRATALAPGDAEALATLAEARRRAAAPAEEVVGLADRALRQDPTNALACIIRGAARLERGEVDLALEDLGRAVALAPARVDAREQLAGALRRSGRVQEALREYDEALRLDPRRSSAYAARAVARICREDLAGARADLRATLDLAPGDAAAWTNLAHVNRRLGDLDEALACAERAVALDPRLAGAWLARGQVWRARGRLDRAVADYGECLHLDPGEALAWNDRGVARYALGDLEGAEADLRACVERAPGLLEARFNLAKVLVLRGGDAARALEELRACRGAGPSATAEEWRAAGVAAFERGWWPHALASFEAALALAPDDTRRAELRVWRAYCLELLGRGPEAVEELRAARPRPWAAIWLTELARDASGLPDAAEAEGWPAPVAAYLRGDLGSEELLAAARAGGPALEGMALFHVARAAAARGDAAGARERFEACVRLAPRTSLQHALARRWLEGER